MKKKMPMLMLILALLSIAAVIGYSIYEKKAASPLPPEISFAQDIIDLPTDASDAQLLDGVSAVDPEDGDVTDSLIVEGMSKLSGNNNVKVSYIAFDSKNNMAKAERTVHLTDYVAPRFAMKKALCFKISNNVNILECIQANDMIDGDISDKVKYSLDGDALAIAGVGEYEIIVRVTNSLGQTVRLPLTVDISQTNPNSANIMLSDYIVYLKKGAEFEPDSYVVGYSANGEQIEGASGLRTSGKVDMDTPGVYTVRYEYGSGANMSYTKLVAVVE